MTGGAGFVGSHLCLRLLSGGDRVACLDAFDPPGERPRLESNLADLQTHPRFELVRLDIRDREPLFEWFRRWRPERVVHLAARPGVAASFLDPAGCAAVNLEGARNVFEAAVEVGVERLVHASSSSVYGDAGGARLEEELPVDRPLSPYAVSKRDAERVAREVSSPSGLSLCCARLFTVYGPRQRPDMAIARFTEAIVRGQAIELFDPGSARDYTYVDDAVDGLLRILDGSGGFEIVNLGAGRPIALARVVAVLEELLGRKATVTASPGRPFEPGITWASLDRAEARYGYRPRVGFEEGVRRFLAWSGRLPGPVPREAPASRQGIPP